MLSCWMCLRWATAWTRNSQSVPVRNRTRSSVLLHQPPSTITAEISLSVREQNRNQFGRMKYSSRLRVRREFKWCGEPLSSDRKLKTSDYPWGEHTKRLCRCCCRPSEMQLELREKDANICTTLRKCAKQFSFAHTKFTFPIENVILNWSVVVFVQLQTLMRVFAPLPLITETWSVLFIHSHPQMTVIHFLLLTIHVRLHNDVTTLLFWSCCWLTVVG